MKLRITHGVGVLLALGALAVAGCGGGPKLGKVYGTVTLDGQPLPNAKVTFQPTFEGGSPSDAVTNENGEYVLKFLEGKEGALVGEHQVRISTYRQLSSTDPGGPGEVPERVPAKYNTETELTKEVTKGSQEISFALTGGL